MQQPTKTVMSFAWSLLDHWSTADIFSGSIYKDCLLTNIGIVMLETDLLFWNHVYLFPYWVMTLGNICFRYWKQGSKRIHRFFHVHSSTPLLSLNSFTLVFLNPVILIDIMYAEEQRRAEDLLSSSDYLNITSLLLQFNKCIV